MAKNLNQEMHVNLSFTADTGKAKSQLKDLQNQLTKIVNLSAKDVGGNVLAQDIEKASLAAAQLKAHLEDATNVDTGKLDLGKLSQNLDSRELKKYRDNLEKLGPTGQKVFLSFAQSIQQAELPLKRTNALMSELWTTMKNTARWQLTSSAMHGFMSAVSSAYGYAKDLNESLNNIRIVSGQSAEQMAEFAEQANKAARALNTTTTSYTNAALIYYQQGLSDEEIQKRTDITIKMANVARQSAEVVSDQLTAVWNNFYKEGEDSLERYADVMTALGAATASSTDEIAGGLEKFASIADMIGLSFDYAASSLATITATTRQSEEVVGTALKTIFARIQGLKLGETLEDGTDLNKYSESLSRVGIEIFDQMGELKDMDNILDEIGAKWEYLGKSEQVALAQAVAGIRQYNQLVSLMDNWNYFQENLDVARSSEGTLDEQAEIFEESWEAASNRVRAAMESIYSDIINDEAFIDLLNNVEKIINGVNSIIDAMGGLKGIITAIGVVGTKVFKNQIGASLQDLAYNVDMSFGSGKKRAEDLKRVASEEMSTTLGEGEGFEQEARATMVRQFSAVQEEFIRNSSKMNSVEQEVNKSLLDRLKILQDIAEARLKEVSIQEEEVSKQKESIKRDLKRRNLKATEGKKLDIDFDKEVDNLAEVSVWFGRMSTAAQKEIVKESGKKSFNYKELVNFLSDNDYGKNYNEKVSGKFLEEFAQDQIITIEELGDKLFDFLVKQETAFENTAKASAKQVKAITEGHIELGESYIHTTELTDTHAKETQRVSNIIEKSAGGTIKTFGDNMIHLAGNISAVIMSLNSFSNALDIINNPDLTTLEKLQSIFGILVMTVPIVITSLKEVANVIKLVSSTHALETVNLGILAAAKMLDIELTEQQTKAYQEQYEVQKKNFKTRDANGKKIYRSQKDIFQKSVDTKKIKDGKYIDPSKYKTSTLAKGFVQELIASKGGMQAILKTLGMLGLKVGAIGLAIGVATVAWTKYQESLPEYKLKVATKAFEDLKTASEQVHTELEELTSMFDSYIAATEVLEQCATGTEEWNEALLEVKKSAGEILQEFPKLLQYENLYNSDGTLNEDVVNQAIAERQKNADELSRTVLAQQAVQASLQVEVDTRALEKEIEEDFRWTSRYVQEGTTSGNYNYKSLVEGLIEKYNSGDYTYEAFMEVAQNEIEALGFVSKQAEEEIANYIPEIIKLAKATKNAEIGLNNIGKNNARENIGVDATNQQIEQYEDIFNDKYKELYTQFEKEYSNNISRFSGSGDSHLKDLWSTYTDSIGMELKLAENAVIHTAEGLIVQYYDEAGEVQKMSLEALIRYKAQVEANTAAIDQTRVNLEAQLINSGIKNADKIFKDDIDLTVLNSFVQNIALSNTELEANMERIKQMYPEITEEEISQMKNGISNLVNVLSGKESINGKKFEELTAAEQQNYLYSYIDLIPESERQQIESQKLINSAVSNYDLDSKDLEDQSARIQEYYEDLELTQIEATKLAIENQRMNEGVKDLHENWIKWGSALRKANLNKENKLTTDYTDTIQDLTKAIAKMVGAADSLKLPDEFFESEENLKNIEAAALGSEEAINKLGVAVGKELVDSMEMVGETIDIEINGKPIHIEQKDFEAAKGKVLAGIAELQEQLIAGNVAVGDSLNEMLDASIDGEQSWIEALNQMALATNMSVEEMNQLLGTLGLEADVSMTAVPQKVQVPKYRIINTPVKDESAGLFGFAYETRSVPMGYEEHDGYVNVAQIGVNGEDPGTPEVKFIGNGSVAPSSTNNTAGGSTPKKTKKSDIVERYKEITDQLNDVSDAASDVSKEIDRLYGANRLAAMAKQNTILQKEIELLKKKKAEAQAYLAADKQEMLTQASSLGVSLEIGEDGNISNYRSVMTSLYDRLHALEVGAGENVNEYEQKSIEDLQEKIDNFKAAIDQYDDTNQILEDTTNEMDDAFNSWQDNNYEKLTYSLELKVEINDMELENLEYYLNKFSDKFFKMAESAALLTGKYPVYEENLGFQAEIDNQGNLVGGFDYDLTEAYKNGEISQSAYIEGLKASREAIYENLNALIELDNQMLTYYEDTLSMASEELSDHTDHLEHLTSVFDHYLSLMDLLGKQKNYKAIGDFLDGKAKNIHNQLNVAKDYYNMLLESGKADEYWANYQAALIAKDTESAQWWKAQWDAIVDATDEAQEQVLSLTEEWASAMKEVIQNNMEAIAKELEKTLTTIYDKDGNLISDSFEEMLDNFDKLNTRQEEYLTKTNQIYETNKLMRTANQALDETDNSVAKQKLKNFIEETKSLQQNTKLSQYELEIQQAKYDLLLAEIALEEAQNAKSTIRMSRDNEGNFGYVYTADQDTIDEAQQGVEDAENRLYNISLEGHQEYTQKYLQAQQEMYNELTALQQAYLDGDIASWDEYKRKKAEIDEHYFGENGILTTYSNLYNVAVRTDADATADYWAKDYAKMTQNTADWEEAVNEYLEEVEKQTKEWAQVSTDANEDVKGALDNSAEASANLQNESDELAGIIQSELIPAIDEEINYVLKQTEAYADQRAELLDLIETYEEYLRLQQEQIEAASSYDANKDYAFSSASNALKGDYEAAEDDIIKGGYKVQAEGGEYNASTRRNIVNWIKGLTEEEQKVAESQFKIMEKYGYTSESYMNTLKSLGYNPNIIYMKTGGYTGAWGPEGKLAVLHEKELVLNQEDTDNLLKTVNFVRELVSAIDTKAQTASLLNMSAISNIHNAGQTLEQQVSIHAEFPNATDRYEIEEAFNSLVNRASQYANRK